VKILVAHNSYQRPGGEDAVCEAEIRLLRHAGHQVVEYLRHNDEIQGHSFIEKASLSWRTSWSGRSHRELGDILARESPDVAHFHNTFPLISFSAYYACRAAGVPVVQTLHNYRLLCPGGNLFRDGRICEDCVSHSLLRSVAHGCYRDSRLATASVAGMLGVHRLAQTWSKQVDLFLVCTEFARKKFTDAGFDGTRMRVKPNFVTSDSGPRMHGGDCALFLGRLSEEKGPQLLPMAWSRLSAAIHLEIVGDGPLRKSLEEDCARLRLDKVHFTGWLEAQAAMERMRRAKFLVVPSMCYEGFPMAVAEAYACGVPVIAAGHGGLAEIVHDGRTGLHFRPGDAADLAAKVEWAWTHPAEMETMGEAARAEYESKYTAAAALQHLETAYAFVLRKCDSSATERTLPATPHRMPSYGVLGVRVDAVQIPDVVSRMEEWIARREACRYVAVTDMHSLMQAQHSASFKKILANADLVVPDGFPLVWLGRRKGFALRRRVYGPELLERFCEETAAKGYRHFFYGGADGVAEDLAARLAARFAGLQIAGVSCPPFRILTQAEDDEAVSLINGTRADVVWVGLGAPKQERWMAEHQSRLDAPVLVGVGAAFDFHTGRVAQAPPWMREHSLEWLFRLLREPGRLWRRYLIYGTEFVALVLLESLGLKKFY
jgi:exopolysaccharide biosynthesis WecB/TagA/CpsF family protein